MSGNSVSNSSESECIVCSKTVEAFSVGVCDHPVCFECSTRMRVLCNQKECPICRQQMLAVIFTIEIEPFAILMPKVENSNLRDDTYGIYFTTSSLQRRYQRLLELECCICKRPPNNVPFKSFHQLKDHMRRAHDLYYCDLCVSNINIFTFERKCYSRIELATHRRKGDSDNKSHRGHPLCEFCDTRFMDTDELFRHLRRDHLFCHFCDADGKHQYYNTYNDLRKHYLDEHFLCEEGDCKFEQFISVFRTDIDLKAHYATVHSKTLSKAANRQARTLELEFTLAPRPRPIGTNPRGNRQYGARHVDRSKENEGAVGYETYYVEPGGPADGPPDNHSFGNPLAAENFPSLSGVGSNTLRTVSNVTITSKVNPLSKDNFPSLGGGPGTSKQQSAVTITRTTMHGQTGLQRSLANFPMLRDNSSSSSGSVRVSVNSNVKEHPSSAKPPNVSIHVNHKANGEITTRISQSTPNAQTVSVRPKTSEAFPALGNSGSKVSEPQWVQVQQKSKKQQEAKVAAKVAAPAPNLPSSSLQEFPTLGKGDSKKMSSSSVWVNLNNFNSNTTAKKNKVVAKSSKTIELAPAPNNATDLSKIKKKKTKLNAASDNLSNSVSKIDINKKTTEVPNNHMSNGLIKKRSELNVEVSEPNTIEGFVYDTTSGSVNKPPPGFKVKPPPGFNNLTANSNDLVFTSSSGQNYPILTQQFYPPPNFKARNQSLIEKFKTVLQTADSIQQFKIYSDMFRNGEIQAEKYYEHCRTLMKNEFQTLFSELLVLLPNVKRQQELYLVHNNKNGAKGLEVCATCSQVVVASDLRNHLTNHILDNHFPTLNQTTTDDSNIWNKK